MTRTAIVMLSLLTAPLFAASHAPYLVKDFPGPIRAHGSLDSRAFWTTIGSTSWFAADTGNGICAQVWKTDGTNHGTVQLTDFTEGGHARSFVGTVNGKIIYNGVDGTGDAVFALGVNDSTPIALLRQGTHAFSSVVFKGELYFIAQTTTGSKAIWKTDGTPAGTTSLDLEGTNVAPRKLAATRDWLIFSGNSGDDYTIFRTGGSMVDTIELGNSTRFVDSDTLTPFGDQVVFALWSDASSSRRVLITDGTRAGTRTLAEGSSVFVPHTVLGGKLLFNFSAIGSTDDVLWATDGTAGGTGAINGVIDPSPGAVVNDRYFFFAPDPDAYRQDELALFTTRAPAGTTTRVFSGFNRGASAERGYGWNGRFYFVASDDTHGVEWWSSDGTATGTAILADSLSGPRSTPIGRRRAVGR